MSRPVGLLLLALALSVVLHAALYHTDHAGQGSMSPHAVPAGSVASWLAHQHWEWPDLLRQGLSETVVKRCPVPEALVWPLPCLRSAAAVFGGEVPAAEPAIRSPYRTALPERPSRVIFQRFRL
jgi:hypothetical protein